MAHKKAELIRKRSRELVSRIYDGVLNPAEYNAIVKAWDQHFDAISTSTQDNPLACSKDGNFDWANEFVAHFERAGEVFDKLHPDNRLSLEDTIRTMPFPAFACDTGGRIVFANELAGAIKGVHSSGQLSGLAFTPESEMALKAFLKNLENGHRPDDSGQLIVQIAASNKNGPHIMVAGLHTGKAGSASLQNHIIFRSIRAEWGNGIQEALARTFELTQAEIELAANLYKGLTIQEIAEHTKKSKATLRTQLSSVLQKTGTKSQSSLLRVIVSLVHMLSQHHARGHNAHTAASLRLISNRDQRSSIFELSNGLAIEYIESGDLAGEPFYFIQPTTRPQLTGSIVKALRENGIRLISPVRPGNGHTTRPPPSYSPADWARLHLELVDSLGIEQFACGGHCSGGIYAAELARLAGMRCKGLLLADTGAPLANMAMIREMPAAPRRLFLAARYFPRAAITPMKFVAADFHSGTDGENRAVEYFYDGSPADQAIMYEPGNWRITRDNIGYCFANIPQLAHDVACWAADNTELFGKVAHHSHIRFFHGGENLMMKPSHIRQFCRMNNNASARIVAGRAQLLIYVEPVLFSEEIARLALPSGHP